MRDQITISELQRQAAQVVSKIRADREPVLVTQRGRVRMVLLDVETFQQLEAAVRQLEAVELRQLVDQGRQAYAEGRFISHADMVEEVARRRSERPARVASK